MKSNNTPENPTHERVMATMLDAIRTATNAHEAEIRRGFAHGAAHMAYALGLITIDAWELYDDECALAHGMRESELIAGR